MRVCQFRHDGNLDLQCSGGRKAAVSGRSTLSILQPCHRLSNHYFNLQREDLATILCSARSPRSCGTPKAEARPTPASQSSKSSHSEPSIRDSLSPPPPHTSEMPPHRLPGPSPPHRYDSM